MKGIDRLISDLPQGLRIVIFFIIILIVAGIAIRKGYLTKGGTLAASFLALFVLYVLGLSGLLPFLFFFLSSSILTKAAEGQKSGMRNFSQVLANGVPPFSGLILFLFSPWPALGLLMFSSSIAEITADTWASEGGLFSHKNPRSILTGTEVPKGTSGGVSLMGIAFSFLGSLSIAFLTTGLFSFPISFLFVITISGILGSLFDSLLGAVFEARYSTKDGDVTYSRYDDEGNENYRISGLPFMDNDMINFISSLFSASLSFLFFLFL